MTRQYKSSYKTHRGVSRFHVSLPYETEPESNSVYWREKLDAAMEKVVNNPALVAIWDSSLVPDHATFKEHAEMAMKLADMLDTDNLSAEIVTQELAHSHKTLSTMPDETEARALHADWLDEKQTQENARY